MSLNKKRNNDNDDSNNSDNKKRRKGGDDLIDDVMNDENDDRFDNKSLKENQKIEKCENILFSTICEKLQSMDDARKISGKNKKVIKL